jgi:SNF2 family DNA or RNA helicase
MNHQNEYIKLDVKVSESLDRLVFVPHDRQHFPELRGALVEHFPGVDFHRGPEGMWTASTEIFRRRIELPGFDLRWNPLSRQFVSNRELAVTRRQEIADRITDILKNGKEAAQKSLADVEGLEILDDHQWVNVNCMTIPEGFGLCVFDEQGTGKTITAIAAFDVLVARNLVDSLLVISPKSMISEWVVAFEKVTHDMYNVSVLTGSKDRKTTSLKKGTDVIITNFETAVSLEQELTSFVMGQNGRSILLVDESFYVKNLNAKRTVSIRHIREYCGRAFVLCGTPAPNDPTDLIQQFNIVDFGLTFSGLVPSKDDRVAFRQIQKRMVKSGLYVRHLKRNTIPNLPRREFHKVIIELSPIQRDLYKSTLQGFVDDLSNSSDKEFRKNIVTFLARRMKLLQISSNPIGVQRAYSEIPAKLFALDQLLKELIEEKDEKVIVWSFFTASLEAIYARYSKYFPVRYDGSVNDINVRREAIRRFSDDHATKLFVGNPAAGGAGLNLQVARVAIYESMSNQASHYLQSLDRIHRRGQDRKVEYFLLLGNGTIEINEYERLLAKEKTARTLLGDPYEGAVSRKEMLDEALSSMRSLKG